MKAAVKCEASRTAKCPNTPWRLVEVSWHGRPLASYWFCRKHWQWLVGDALSSRTNS